MAITIGLVCIAVSLVSLVFLSQNKKIKQQEKQTDAVIKEQGVKNELKESMETGDDSADFDTSLDILHNLAKK